MIWQHRVDSEFRNANIPMQASEALIWRRVQLQLRALIKRLHCTRDTAVSGAQLAACYDNSISAPREQSVLQAGLSAIPSSFANVVNYLPEILH